MQNIYLDSVNYSSTNAKIQIEVDTQLHEPNERQES